MLRSTDYGGGGSSGGGGRPPVNIEVNFTTGKGGSAFAQAREDLAAIKRDIDEIRAKGLTGGLGGGGGSGGGISFGGGGGGIRFGGGDGATSANVQSYGAPGWGAAAAGANMARGGFRATGVSSITGMPMPTQPVATAAAASPMFSAGGAVGLPLAAIAALGIGIGANTRRGVSELGGIGSWLEGATNRDSFAFDFFRTAGLPNFANPAAAFNETLGPFRQQRELTARTNRLLGQQSVDELRSGLLGADAIAGAGFGLSGLDAAKATNAARIKELTATALENRGGDSVPLEDRLRALSGLKEAERERYMLQVQGVEAEREKLRILNQGVVATQKTVDNQIGGLTGMRESDQRKLEAAFKRVRGGSGTEKDADLLARAGIVTDDVRRIQQGEAGRNMPRISEFLQQSVREREESFDRQYDLMSAAERDLNKFVETAGGKVTTVIETVAKRIEELDTAMDDLLDRIKARDSQGRARDGQSQNVPGVAGGGGGLGGVP